MTHSESESQVNRLADQCRGQTTVVVRGLEGEALEEADFRQVASAGKGFYIFNLIFKLIFNTMGIILQCDINRATTGIGGRRGSRQPLAPKRVIKQQNNGPKPWFKVPEVCPDPKGIAFIQFQGIWKW